MTNLHHWLYVILLQMGAIIYSYCVFQSSKEERHGKNFRVYSTLWIFFFWLITPWILTIAKRLEKFKKGANESHGLAGYRWVRADNMSTSTSYIKEAMPLQCLCWFIESFFSFLFLFQVLNHCYSVILVCLSGIAATVATVLFVLFFSFKYL